MISFKFTSFFHLSETLDDDIYEKTTLMTSFTPSKTQDVKFSDVTKI